MWDAGAGSVSGHRHRSVGLQHLLVLQPSQGTGVLVIVGILQVLQVRSPPDDGPQGAVGVAVGQEAAAEAPGHGGQAAVQPQHPVQVEGQHLVQVPGALDEPTAPIVAVSFRAGWQDTPLGMSLGIIPRGTQPHSHDLPVGRDAGFGDHLPAGQQPHLPEVVSREPRGNVGNVPLQPPPPPAPARGLLLLQASAGHGEPSSVGSSSRQGGSPGGPWGGRGRQRAQGVLRGWGQADESQQGQGQQRPDSCWGRGLHPRPSPGSLGLRGHKGDRMMLECHCRQSLRQGLL